MTLRRRCSLRLQAPLHGTQTCKSMPVAVVEEARLSRANSLLAEGQVQQLQPP